MEDRQAYQDKREAQYRLWCARIDELRARADIAKADVKIAYREQLDSLQKKQRTAREKLDALKAASGEAWTDLRAGVESAWHDLKEGIESAYHKLK